MIYVVASKCSQNHFIFRAIKQFNNLSYTAFKIVPLCNNTLLPVTVKVLETFLEAILYKPLQLHCCILNYVGSITLVPLLQCWIQLREEIKLNYSQVRRAWGMLHALSHCSLLRNSWPKLTGVLEHCHEGETNCWFPIFWSVSFSPHPKGAKRYPGVLLYSQ